MTDAGSLTARDVRIPGAFSKKTPGLQYVAVDRSTVLVERHQGAADLDTGRAMLADTTMMAYSMSKTITAVAVLQLVDARQIGLDDPVARYLDWQPYGPAITIRQLLSHTSGAPNPLPLRWVHPAAAHVIFDERAALTAVLRDHPRLAFAPGAKYAYSNIGYWLLGWVVAEASGRPFTRYVAEQVLSPLGLTAGQMSYTIADTSRHATGYLERYSIFNLIKPWLIDRQLIGEYSGRWLEIREHYPNGPAFGGLVGSALAFARFLQDQLAPGSRVLSDRARSLLIEPQHTASGRSVGMTLGWHIGSNRGARYFFKEGGGGGFHSMMRLYPDAGLGTVVMTNATASPIAALLDALDADVLDGGTPPPQAG